MASPFTRWSRWFEEALTDYHHEYPEHATEWEKFDSLKPDVIGVMGWIISSADSSGTGFGLDAYSDRAIAKEIKSTPENVRACIEALASVGLIDLVEDHPASPVLQASLSRGGGPFDESRCARLIEFLPWNKGSDR